MLSCRFHYMYRPTRLDLSFIHRECCKLDGPSFATKRNTPTLCVLFVTTFRSMKLADTDTTVSVKKTHSDSCFKQLGPSRKEKTDELRHVTDLRLQVSYTLILLIYCGGRCGLYSKKNE